MKQKEIDILNLYSNETTLLSSQQIKNKLHLKDPSGTLRDLVYFDYLIIENDSNFRRTEKPYDINVRETETYEQNYEIVLNKIFTGSFLTYNLGHEIINFIADDNGQRYVYLNPWGKRSEEAALNTKYAFHIIESAISDENGIYELAAVSEIDLNAVSHYSKNKFEEREYDPIFSSHSFYDIFHCGTDSDKAHAYSYKSSKFFKPVDGIRIIIKINRPEAIFHDIDDNKLVLELTCNPQHNICYADSIGKKTYGSSRNAYSDLDVLYKLLNNESPYLVEDNSNVNIDNLDDEQCFAIISGRAQLEVSTSNQIAYFLQRDKTLLYKFLHDFCGIDSVKQNESFEIVREKEKNIDLLFKNDNHIVVVENKIDSCINNVTPEVNDEGKHQSQLSKYFDYVEEKYKNVSDRTYFVLAPEYNEITQEKLNNEYVNGDKYTLKTYKEFFDEILDYEYIPLGLKASIEGRFLFEQFKKSIEYLTWSNAMKHERTAYIRLKQRLNELNNRR